MIRSPGARFKARLPAPRGACRARGGFGLSSATVHSEELMKIDITQKGNITIVSPHGDIRIGQGDVELREAFRKLLDEDHRSIVIDMSGVNFMDSAGLGEVVACHRRVTEKGGEIKLAALNPRINDLFTLTKLFLVFKIFDSVDEAVATFPA